MIPAAKAPDETTQPPEVPGPTEPQCFPKNSLRNDPISLRESDGGGWPLHQVLTYAGLSSGELIRANSLPVSVCCVNLLPLRLTRCNPMDYNLPGSPVRGILQARILERVALPSSRGSS